MSLSAKFVSLLVPSQKNASWTSKASEQRPCWRPSRSFLINRWHFFQTLSEQHWQRAGGCKRVTLRSDGDESPVRRRVPASVHWFIAARVLLPALGPICRHDRQVFLQMAFADLKSKKVLTLFTTEREAFVTTAFPFTRYNHRWGTSVAPGSLQPLLTVSPIKQ